MLRKDMIKQIKKWFKDFCKRFDPIGYCVLCGDLDLAGHPCPIKFDDSKPLFNPSHKEAFEHFLSKSLVEESYKIFKATKLHPAIPVENYQAFFVDCRTLTENEVLDRVIDEVVSEYAEDIIQSADTEKLLLEKRNRMLGADEVRKRLLRYTNSIEKKEDFNQFETI